MAVSGGTKSWARLEPHPGKMPAWKLEVLERKRAKMASAAAAPASPGRRSRSPGRTSSPERLVLQDSLGPLHENPFIKLEKERRRRRQQQHPSPGRATSPIRHLLDLYGNVPGIRTIRAENIIIIESDPGFFSQPSLTDPVGELLAKRGSKVAEIRASEVVIYEPEVPNKQPNNKTPQFPRKGSMEHSDVLEEAGRVSRLLEKFDHSGKPVRTRSLENLLDRSSKPPLLPKPSNQVLQSKPPKRPAEVSLISPSFLDEDSKRFPLNNPSWLPSKPPVVHSLPDPGLFHKKPACPVMSPSFVAPLSPSSPLGHVSTQCETSMDDKPVSPTVATVRERFEVGNTNNNHPLSKLMNVAQKTGSNTLTINPKAALANKARPPESPNEGIAKDCLPLMNGHVDHSDEYTKSGSSISIEDLLFKSKRPRGNAVQRSSEGSGQVPSSANSSPNDIHIGANTWRPKSDVDLPKSSIPQKPSATLSDNHCYQGFTSATPSQKMKVSDSTSSNDSFEIRPAAKLDLSKIPDNDIQAKALANLRMQSKNSFLFVPKKRQVPSTPTQEQLVPTSTKDKPKVQTSASTLNGPKFDITDSIGENLRSSKDAISKTPFAVNAEENIEHSVGSITLKASNVPSLSDFDWKSGLLPSKSSTESHSFTDLGAELEYFSSVDIGPVPVTKIHDVIVKPGIPVTNIDDIVNVEDQSINKEAKPAFKVPEPATSPYQPQASLSSIRPKGTNTFTVVPKRKPVTEQEAFRTPIVEEDDDDDDDTRSKRKSSDGSEVPYSELGALLKKRYPTAEEIQVIGGYQSLSKSCLSKNSSSRKKMKISFNEQNIHTMFEYPSENSLAEEIGEESNEMSESESEDEEKPSCLFLPRPSFVSGGAGGNSLRANTSNSGLSNYTPKHSVEYSKWQDESALGEMEHTETNAHSGDMLTPADSNSHTDFRSEPALYF